MTRGLYLPMWQDHPAHEFKSPIAADAKPLTVDELATFDKVLMPEKMDAVAAITRVSPVPTADDIVRWSEASKKLPPLPKTARDAYIKAAYPGLAPWQQEMMRKALFGVPKTAAESATNAILSEYHRAPDLGGPMVPVHDEDGFKLILKPASCGKTSAIGQPFTAFEISTALDSVLNSEPLYDQCLKGAHGAFVEADPMPDGDDGIPF